MSLFGGYENAGVGIAKNAPKKKPFFHFWEVFGRKFWKLIEVNMVHTLFMLPMIFAFVVLTQVENESVSFPLTIVLMVLQLVLFGPSMAGFTKVIRNFSQERHAYIWSDYISAFRKNFKLALPVGIVDILLLVSVTCGFYVYPILLANSGSRVLYVPFVLMLSIAVAVIMMNFYMFLMIVSTDLSLKNIVKNSFALSFIAFKKNLITFVLTVGIAILTVFLLQLNPITIFILPFVPASFAWLIVCFNSYPVIQKYVINPYYEQRGEENPELMYGADPTPSGMDMPAEVAEEAAPKEAQPLFEDRGGSEKPIIAKKKKRNGKTIS